MWCIAYERSGMRLWLLRYASRLRSRQDGHRAIPDVHARTEERSRLRILGGTFSCLVIAFIRLLACTCQIMMSILR